MIRRRTIALVPATIGLVLAASVGAPVKAEAQAEPVVTTYTYVPLGWLGIVPVGRPFSEAADVNMSRQVVGYSSTDTSPAGHAFFFEDGRMEPVAPIYAPGQNGATSINDSGHIAGYTHVNNTDPPHAFIRRDGVTIDLGTGWGSGSGSAAHAINNKGVVVGQRHESAAHPTRPVMWKDGRIRDLGTLGGEAGQARTNLGRAYDINDKDQVVGESLPSTGYPMRGFLWENGRMTDLGTLADGGRGDTVAQAINEKTQITGWSPDAANKPIAFLWEAGSMRALGTLLGGTRSYGHDINESGQVVGLSYIGDSLYVHRAFLWKNGQMTDLNTVVTNLPPDVSLATAHAINDDGVIVGRTCYHCEPGKTADEHAYMLIPNS
ncbi:hypothetical protein ACQEUU_03020 [Nonomuraea sp. CA-218870]|uniref:hypothetical protein n=1 Tax=Nonomuraea sp. CA-218870 TaxID=3239998 RepID=UPI003D908BB1